MEIVILLVGTVILGILGIGVGMLLAPRIDRWAAPPNERAPGEAGPHDDRH